MKKDLVFATDVANFVKQSGKMSSSEKTRTTAGYILAGDVVAYFLMARVARAWLGVSAIFVLLLLVILNVVIGVWYLRTFVIREMELLKESKDSERDSFTRFIKILGETDTATTVFNDVVYTQMFNDGSMFNVVELLFGKGSDELYKGNKEFFMNVYKLAFAFGLEIRSTVTREDFSKSPEYAKWVEDANSHSAVSPAPIAMDIIHGIVNESNEVSSVPAIYFQFKASNAQNNKLLIEFNKQMLSLLVESHTSIRCMKFLKFEEVTDYLQEFHGVGAINLDVGKASDYTIKAKESLLLTSEDLVHTVMVVRKNRELDPVDEISSYFELEEIRLNHEN